MSTMQSELVLADQPPQTSPYSGTTDLLRSLATAAHDQSVDAAKVRELWSIMQEIQNREAERAYLRDFQRACSEMEPVLRDIEVKNSRGDVTNRYARLEAIDKQIRPIYTRYGFVLSFGGGPDNSAISCKVIHRDGHVENYFVKGVMDASNAAKSALQAVGSTLTYLRRYLTCLIFNIQFTNDPDDNDGREFITDDQVQTLRGVLGKCDDFVAGNEPALCRHMNVHKLEEIPAGMYQQAITLASAKLNILRKGVA